MEADGVFTGVSFLGSSLLGFSSQVTSPKHRSRQSHYISMCDIGAVFGDCQFTQIDEFNSHLLLLKEVCYLDGLCKNIHQSGLVSQHSWRFIACTSERAFVHKPSSKA